MIDATDLDSLPEEFIERLTRILPAGVDLVKCFGAKDTSFRVNTLQGPAELAMGELADAGIRFESIDWCANAFRVRKEDRDLLVRTSAFNEGRIYVQNISSLLPVIALDPKPDETVLDLAAAPGGKTLHIACLMQNRGTLSAVEPIKSRFFRLRRNLDLHGATMVKTYMTDGRTVGNKTGPRFDKILLDAPCSSEARVRIDRPESWSYWSLRKIREQSRKQVGLLKSAIRALKPGGMLLYCTCSFAPEENELVVQKQMKHFGGQIRIESIDLPILNTSPGVSSWNDKHFDRSLEKCCRVLPTESFDGFFLAKIMKE